MHDLYVGIDLAIAKKKRLPVIVLSKQYSKLRVIEGKIALAKTPVGIGNALSLQDNERLAFAARVCHWLHNAEKILRGNIQRIAIDAPREFCRSGQSRRAAELAMDSLGVSCFSTPTEEGFFGIRESARQHLDKGGPEAKIPHANKIWMLAGFDIFGSSAEFVGRRGPLRAVA